jgi:hypothetical protein
LGIQGFSLLYYKYFGGILEKLVLCSVLSKENISNQQVDEFLSFVISTGALDLKKLRTSSKSYGTDLKKIVNLSGQDISGVAGPAIVLKCEANYSLQNNNVIIFNSVTQSLS